MRSRKGLPVRISQFALAVALTLLSVSGARAQSASQAEVEASTSHAGGIIGVDISLDGRLVVSSGNDGTVKLWDVSSGILIRTYVGAEGGTNLLKFRPEGDAFVAAGTGSRQPAKMLSALSRRTLKSFPQEIPPDSMGFLRAGNALYFGSEFRWELWDMPTTKRTKSADRVYMGSPGKKSEVVSNVAVFDGKVLLLSNAKKFPSRLVEEGTFKLIRKYPNSEWDSACFIDNGARFIAASISYKDDQTTVSAYTYDTQTGQRLQKVDMPAEKSEIICLPGKGIAYVTEGAIHILSGAGQRVSSRKISGGAFKPDGQLALSGDGSLAVYGSPDESRLELWSVESGRLLRTFSAPGIAATNNYRISDRITAVVAKDFVAQVDIGSGRVLSVFQNGAEITVAHPFANRIVIGDKQGRVRVVDLASSKVVRDINAGLGPIGGLVASSRRDRIAVLGKDSQLVLLEASSGRTITSMQFAKPDGRDASDVRAPRIVPSASEGEFFVVATPEFVLGGKLNRISFDNGKILKTTELNGEVGMVTSSGAVTRNSGTGGQDIWPMQLFSLETGKAVRRIDNRPEDHVAAVSAMDQSIDGKTLLVGRADAGIDQIDIASGRYLRTLAGHKSSVSSVRMITPDRLVSTSGDGSVNLWDSRTGSLLASTFFFSATDWLTITPEGFFDISSPKAARYLSLVRGLDVSSVDQVYNVLYRPDLVREKLAGDAGGKVKAAAAQLDLEKVMASGAPPRVAVDAPVAGAPSLGSVEIRAIITDRGGGIGKVEWRVNGVTLGVEERGIKRSGDAPAGSASSPPTKTLQVSRTLGLAPGENRIAVLAYNEAGLIASESAEIVVTSAQSEGGAKPRLYVLAVGVNDYWDSALRLSFAASDARSMGDGLKQAGSKLYERVVIRTVLDADATAEKLDAVFTEMAKQVRPQDVFVFFLAGHGKTVDARFYFLPQDFRYAGEDSIVKQGVGQDRLQEWFSRIKAQKSVLLFDACESGSLIGDKIAMRGIEEKTAIDRMTRAMGRTMLTATTDSKPAVEGYRGHGVFTYTLLAGLDAADANNDGVIDVTELAQYVDRRLPDLTFDAFRLRQVPQMSIVGSNFPLASKVALLPAGNPSVTSIPTKPTHVVVAPADVKTDADQAASTLSQLTPGAQVYLMRTENGWTLVARNGQKLGYVRENTLLRLQ